ncbi:MAG: RNA polymerase sigma factor [Planctomycetaceae bacterium]
MRLLDRLVQNDAAAWREFVTNYQRLVFSRVRRVLVQFGRGDDHSLAEDLCADVFAMLLANDCAQLRKFEGRSKLSTWLDVVVRRISIRKLTQLTARVGKFSEPSHLETVVGATGEDRLAGENRQQLATALQQLSEADQQVLHLFYFDQRSYAQIAASLNLSTTSVGPKLKRAQQRLRKILSAGNEGATD